MKEITVQSSPNLLKVYSKDNPSHAFLIAEEYVSVLWLVMTGCQLEGLWRCLVGRLGSELTGQKSKQQRLVFKFSFILYFKLVECKHVKKSSFVWKQNIWWSGFWFC